MKTVLTQPTRVSRRQAGDRDQEEGGRGRGEEGVWTLTTGLLSREEGRQAGRKVGGWGGGGQAGRQVGRQGRR